MNDPPVWRQLHKPGKICDKENNETNSKAISLSSFFFVLESKKKDGRGRNNRRALGLARNDEGGGRDGS
jgi:hypothetical protein